MKNNIGVKRTFRNSCTHKFFTSELTPYLFLERTIGRCFLWEVCCLGFVKKDDHSKRG